MRKRNFFYTFSLTSPKRNGTQRKQADESQILFLCYCYYYFPYYVDSGWMVWLRNATTLLGKSGPKLSWLVLFLSVECAKMNVETFLKNAFCKWLFPCTFASRKSPAQDFIRLLHSINFRIGCVLYLLIFVVFFSSLPILFCIVGNMYVRNLWIWFSAASV